MGSKDKNSRNTNDDIPLRQNSIKTKSSKESYFERFSRKVTQATGSTAAFLIAGSCVIIWAVSGPMFNFSETWQLVINTGTTIVTFLMVFLIQKSQNRDSAAVQMKLNEIVAATKNASNRLIDVEDLSEEELVKIKEYYVSLKEKATKENSLKNLHSIEEMETDLDNS